MMGEWETKEEKITRFMSIAAEKKMEWLRQMQEFTLKTSSKQLLSIRWHLRRKKSFGESVKLKK